MNQRSSLFVLSTYALFFLSLWGCVGSTDPTPDTTVYVGKVNSTTGHTEIDTTALREKLTSLAGKSRPRPDEIPILAHLYEVEKLGSEAVRHVLLKYENPVSVLADIQDAEESQAAAMDVILDVFDIDDPSPDDNVGDFQNQEIQSVWDDHIDHAKHNTDMEAVIAVTRVFEYQLNVAIDARALMTEASGRYTVEVIYAMNKNHFLALFRYLKSRGVQYTPLFLSPDEFSEESNGNYLSLT